MVWVSLWVVPRVLSFVFDRQGSVRLIARGLNGVWQGMVGFAEYEGSGRLRRATGAVQLQSSMRHRLAPSCRYASFRERG